jgi:dTDP-glucose pyrophosphorylase
VKEQIKIGVIPAAGKGNRLKDLPLTKILPKVMLPILNKPILEYVIQTLKDLNAEEIYIIVDHEKNVIMDYFGNGNEFGVKIKYVEQSAPLGIADAISRVKNFVNEPFIVILGDSFFLSHNLSDLVKVFWEKTALAAEGIVAESSIATLRRTCSVLIDNEERIIDIDEKPEKPKSIYRGIGTYVFDPIVFEYIEQTPVGPPRGEREITNTIKLMTETKRVYARMIKGIEINVNTLEDLINATNLMLLNQKGKNL